MRKTAKPAIGNPLPFAKIYGQEMCTSSLWLESPATRCLFLWFLCQADERGLVKRFAMPMIGRLANLSEKEVEEGMEVLLSPDEDSRTPDHDGRRLVPLEGGGWLVVNAVAYREIRTQKQVDEAERKANYRANSRDD